MTSYHDSHITTDDTRYNYNIRGITYTCTNNILMQRRLYINKAHTNFSYFLMQDFTLAGAVGGLNSLSYAHTQ